MASVVLLNGKFLPDTEAVVSVDDGGWLHGAALFETMRAENSTVFRLESHAARLHRSAAALLRPVPKGVLPTPDDLAELLDCNGVKMGRVRITVSAGSMRVQPDTDEPALNVCVTVAPLGGYDAKLYKAGMSAAISPFRTSPTDPLGGHKTTAAQLPRLLSLRSAQAVGCGESIWFTTEHRLAEGSISNVFVVCDGVLKTPPLNTPVLPGIARGVVFEIAADEGIECCEAALTINDLLDAEEVFLTNAIMQVMPVSRIEKSDINEGKVGPMTMRMLDAYRDLVRKECRSS